MMTSKSRLEEIKARLEAATPGEYWNIESDYRTKHGSYGSRPVIGKPKFDPECPIDQYNSNGPGIYRLDCSWQGNWDESNYQNDKNLIRNAPTDIAWLISEVERLQVQLINDEWNYEDLMKLKTKHVKKIQSLEAKLQRQDEMLKECEAELNYLTDCRCDSVWTDRNRHEPNSHCGYSDDVLAKLKEIRER